MDKIPQEKQTKEVDPDEAVWPPHGLVQFDNVSVRYRKKTEIVLKNLSFTVKSGHKIGVCGRTGAGKSTLALTLSRIIELEEGKICIDNIDIFQVDLQLLRAKITVIPQDPTLFSGSLRFNLDPLNMFQDANIISLLQKAGLQDLLARGALSSSNQQDKTSNGLNLTIEEGGNNLSMGEKQLICICRAILRKNKIVILDEATANIDVVTEQKILQLINEEFSDSTVITIAHRLNTIMKSDMVLLLANGEIQEYDSPQALMANPDSQFSSLLKELQKEQN